MKVTTTRTFKTLKITIDNEHELQELVGVLARVDVTSSPFINDLYSKLSEELGLPMAGLFQGKLTINT